VQATATSTLQRVTSSPALFLSVSLRFANFGRRAWGVGVAVAVALVRPALPRGIAPSPLSPPAPSTWRRARGEWQPTRRAAPGLRSIIYIGLGVRQFRFGSGADPHKELRLFLCTLVSDRARTHAPHRTCFGKEHRLAPRRRRRRRLDYGAGVLGACPRSTTWSTARAVGHGGAVLIGDSRWQQAGSGKG